jgi:Fe-S-cluster containining protein
VTAPAPQDDTSATSGDAPWYKDGLRFKCTQCGDCCTGAPGYVWVNQEEVKAIAEVLGKSVGEVRLEHTRLEGRRTTLKEFANGDCTFFDGKTRGCKIYSVRPRQCRTWPFWDSNLESPETWAETCEVCPGSGKGDLYPLDEIVKRAGVIRI